MKAIAALVVCSGLAMTSSAGATVVAQFQLHDHPDAFEAPPPYGLRLDNIIGNGLSTLSMDFHNDTVLTVYDDGGNLSINITGTLYGGEVVGNAYVSPESYAVDFTYAVNVVPFDGGWEADGFSTSNTGTLTNLSDNSVIDLYGKPEPFGTAFVFAPNGHRLDDPNAWVGLGWLTDQVDGSDPHDGFRDWIFTATPIPAPGAFTLLGLGGLVSTRRRR